MSVVKGLEVLTSAYLGQDWDLFGKTPDDAMANFARGQSRDDVAASIAGIEKLLASTMTEDELDDQWIMKLHAAYDPRDDGMTYRQFLAHALEVLRTASTSP